MTPQEAKDMTLGELADRCLQGEASSFMDSLWAERKADREDLRDLDPDAAYRWAQAHGDNNDFDIAWVRQSVHLCQKTDPYRAAIAVSDAAHHYYA